ncbi:hypothetical protein [Terribacillus saccharophilus]|uniref:Uncharacterized protein n=2 Tax=Terribacillus saccharophilus TaxID=361277 RepID=A0ABX4GYX1_9BACI|nr:hypothetical protein [Terribacillus saccharophilus]PAD35539.1 hypothetical protein CHH56_08750 [Terribacillus saccharophilus]PAD96500.1 hypothetical protein CHH50_07810 [Terribacillus saccharophilus]PAE00076.1 hypothetical protein CHH48_08715 [Terribacillus saccharophilus]
MKSKSSSIAITLTCCCIFLCCHAVEASLDPNSSVSINNKRADIFICSSDPVFQETNGKYSTEDFQNAIPAEMPVAEESWLETLLHTFFNKDTQETISSDTEQASPQMIPYKRKPISLYPQNSYIHCLLSAHMNTDPYANLPY